MPVGGHNVGAVPDAERDPYLIAVRNMAFPEQSIAADSKRIATRSTTARWHATFAIQRLGRVGDLKKATSCLPVSKALVKRHHCWHYEPMAIQINIRDVPEKVRDELAARAALQGKSMQEFLRAELERLASRPSIDAWLQQVRKRKRASQTRISSEQILESRNADRS